MHHRLCTYGIEIPATLNMALPSVLITALNGILSVYSERVFRHL